jgi:hypothetical protein
MNQNIWRKNNYVLGKISNPLPGRKGTTWWNNGIKNKCCKEHPGEGWTKGKIRKQQVS